ncbi:hypothetical protein I5907_08005 [Panacibacter sp. DH6]|uniref:Lipocalin-like domain-containing protein n=2 Tax=Panacibacter microcysteis TaxID=2793269 RepID=A0A931E6Q4_9BACT|nr:hypothetical protein [Panacibacter microcysteis]
MFLLLTVIGIFGLSCSKSSNAGLPEGTWKLTTIYDRVNDITLLPANGTGDHIVLQFRGNSFSGSTFKNTITDGSFTTPGAGKIVFGFYNTTYVEEDEFGHPLLSVLSSCLLSSSSPCKPCDYTLEGDKLIISSPYIYELTFER